MVTVLHHKPQTTVTKPTAGTYVALGDSVAAGYGLSPDSDSSACDRTDAAYPNVIAKQLNLTLKNFACASAQISAGIMGPQIVNDLSVPAQLDRLYAMPKPSLITLTIGANDSGWTEIISSCYRSDCGSDEQTAQVQARIATATASLKSLLTSIVAHYNGTPPHIIVTDYHQILSPTAAACADTTGLSAAAITWARAQDTALNTAIQNVVASVPEVAFAHIDFDGHELCTSDSWVQGTGDPAPYHPTAAGQEAYAKAVLAANATLK